MFSMAPISPGLRPDPEPTGGMTYDTTETPYGLPQVGDAELYASNTGAGALENLWGSFREGWQRYGPGSWYEYLWGDDQDTPSQPAPSPTPNVEQPVTGSEIPFDAQTVALVAAVGVALYFAVKD